MSLPAAALNRAALIFLQSAMPHPVSIASNATTTRKAVKAAQEFEAMLVKSMLENLHFGLTPGIEERGGDGNADANQTYGSLASEALASALTEAGGLGIAKMLQPKLQPNLTTRTNGHVSMGSARNQDEAKVGTISADSSKK